VPCPLASSLLIISWDQGQCIDPSRAYLAQNGRWPRQVCDQPPAVDRLADSRASDSNITRGQSQWHGNHCDERKTGDGVRTPGGCLSADELRKMDAYGGLNYLSVGRST